MLVEVVRLGYYELKRRYPGEVFDYKGDKIPSWCKLAGSKEVVKEVDKFAELDKLVDEAAAKKKKVSKKKSEEPKASDQAVI